MIDYSCTKLNQISRQTLNRSTQAASLKRHENYPQKTKSICKPES